MDNIKRFSLLNLLMVCLVSNARAEIPLNKEETVSIYGDTRLRLESDFSGNGATGQNVDDRTRARIRARLGLKYQPLEWLTFDTRIRTGQDDSHQSPHITVYDFNSHDSDTFDANFDRWYVQAKHDDYWLWAGRNNFPFWSQEEIFWDDDATIVGVAGGTALPLADAGNLTLGAGYFALPVGMQDFSGRMAAAEAIYSKDINGITFSVGESVFNFIPDRTDSDAARLKNANGLRDYRIWVTNVGADWEMYGLPFKTEFDWLFNSVDYSASDANAFTAANHDQTDGYVFTLKAGDVEKQDNWLAAYYYAYIETFAVNGSYAQDEWTRFGSSNIKGHQFNLGYAITDDLNVLGRLYLVDSITTQEQSNRFRVDVNYKF